ncbi:hypothetical protein J43TS9_52570 [Paenibacillus cineris]|nr:hypothetical protein J43TS9_52570 [Paenibacillus cineris]
MASNAKDFLSSGRVKARIIARRRNGGKRVKYFFLCNLTISLLLISYNYIITINKFWEVHDNDMSDEF